MCDHHHFCTIITSDYMPFALNLHSSIMAQGRPFVLHVLVSRHAGDAAKDIPSELPSSLRLHFIDEVATEGIGKALFEKYARKDSDALRWSLKPVFMNWLLRRPEIGGLVYVDCDIHFFNDYAFIFEKLQTSGVLLTPHWLPYRKPVGKGLFNFDNHFTDGLFNAGFVAASKSGAEALDWWAEACLFKCEHDRRSGYFVDQTYLNVMHTYFPGVNALRHKGCNVAFWNQTECRREIQPDGAVKIDGEYPLVFIHFPVIYMDLHLAGLDKALFPYFIRYFKGLRRFGLDNYGSLFKKAANILRFKLEDIKRSGARRVAIAASPKLLDNDCGGVIRASGLKCVYRVEDGGVLDRMAVSKSGADSLLAVCRPGDKAMARSARSTSIPTFVVTVPRKGSPGADFKPPSPVIARTFSKLKSEGIRTALLYGAGAFTLKHFSCLQPSHGISILGILDDDPAKHGSIFCGMPVLGEKESMALRPDAIIISSDTIQDILYANAIRRFPGVQIRSIVKLKRRRKTH